MKAYIALFLLGMVPSLFLTMRFSYTLPLLPCGNRGHQLFLLGYSGSGLTTTVRFSLSETNLKALYIPYSVHLNETPWKAIGHLLSIYPPVWGKRQRNGNPCRTAPHHHFLAGSYAHHVSETLTRTLVSLRQSDIDASVPWRPVVFVIDDAHLPLTQHKVCLGAMISFMLIHQLYAGRNAGSVATLR